MQQQQVFSTDENNENTGQQEAPQNNLQEIADDTTKPENIEHEPLLEHTTSTGVVSGSLLHTYVHNVGQSVGKYVTRLAKLTLPSFSGDPLDLQAFWDSFEAVVHNNEGLTGVQKFHHLRALLLGDAAQVIANFPLTEINYLHSVKLLKDRFGQPYKLANAHMACLYPVW